MSKTNKLFLLLFVLSVALYTCRTVPTSYNSSTDSFAGHDRAQAKTTPATGNPQVVATITELLQIIPSDAAFISSGITRSSRRTIIEQKNYTVTNAFLYGISHESDNDFHLILGDSLGNNFMNAEASGLPASNSPAYTTLNDVRSSIKKAIGIQFLSQRGYTVFKIPKKVTVTGSLFFDADHAPGVVGFGKCKPNTSVEIHPIINFSLR